MDEAASDYRLDDHNTVFKPGVQGCGTPSEDREKKGGIKVHTVIRTNEGVPSDIKFTSTATNDSFIAQTNYSEQRRHYGRGRAYIDYAKFQQLTGAA